MKLQRLLELLLSGLLLAGIASCTTIPPDETSSIGGTGSEVVGVVEYPDSADGTEKRLAGYAFASLPVIDGPVFINPVNYLAKPGNGNETPQTYTLDDGSFSIRNVVPGTHLIYIRGTNGTAIARRVTVNENEPRVNVGTLYAEKTAGVSISYTGTTPGNVLFYIDIRGTDIQLRCADRDVAFALDNIPVGTDYSVVVRLRQPLSKDYEFSLNNPLPGVMATLQSITGE